MYRAADDTLVLSPSDLGGTTVPFSDAHIQGLYPTFDRYQRLMKKATNRAAADPGAPE